MSRHTIGNPRYEAPHLRRPVSTTAKAQTAYVGGKTNHHDDGSTYKFYVGRWLVGAEYGVGMEHVR